VLFWPRAIAVWLLIMLLESVLATLRALFLAPAIGDFPARQLGVLTGCVLVFLVTLIAFIWLRARSGGALLRIGALWVSLTVLFEAGLGRLVLGFDWARILSDYDLSRGGLMGLGLVAMLLTPLVVGKIRGLPVKS